MTRSGHRGCPKVRYSGWAQANRRLLKLQTTFKGPESKKPKRAYHCHKCLGFHLTSKEF